ncbi:MAG: heme A synthase [SAR202 cluster bacterium]|nr:heme A synthase [SAR202 cluster bacterium]
MSGAGNSITTTPFFQRLVLVTLAAIFALIVLGGVVRVTESGLGCPDWPLCHGKIIPHADFHTLIEYSHRIAASVVGLLVLAVAVLAWVKYRGQPWIVWPAITGLVLVLAQGALGGVTVLTELHGKTVTAHLGLAEALLGLTIFLFLASMGGVKLPDKGQKGVTALAVSAAVGVYALLLTGSYVTTSGASGACPDWPLCQDMVFFNSKFPIIHMLHRCVALAAGVLVAAAVVAVWRSRPLRRDAAWLGLAALAVFLAQVVVGAVTVLGGLTAELRALHLAMASLTWGLVAALAVLPYTRELGGEAKEPFRNGATAEHSSTGRRVLE